MLPHLWRGAVDFEGGGVELDDPTVIRAVMDRYGLLQEQLAAEFGL